MHITDDEKGNLFVEFGPVRNATTIKWYWQVWADVAGNSSHTRTTGDS